MLEGEVGEVSVGDASIDVRFPGTFVVAVLAEITVGSCMVLAKGVEAEGR